MPIWLYTRLAYHIYVQRPWARGLISQAKLACWHFYELTSRARSTHQHLYGPISLTMTPLLVNLVGQVDMLATLSQPLELGWHSTLLKLGKWTPLAIKELHFLISLTRVVSWALHSAWFPELYARSLEGHIHGLSLNLLQIELLPLWLSATSKCGLCSQ